MLTIQKNNTKQCMMMLRCHYHYPIAVALLSCLLVSAYALLRTNIITSASSSSCGVRKCITGPDSCSYGSNGNRRWEAMVSMAVDDAVPGPEEVDAAIDASPLSSISSLKEGIELLKNLNGSDVRVGIIMARWNADIVQGLYKGVNESLVAAGVLPSNVFTTYVPGAFELPVTAKLLAASKRVDVIVNLGCLIKGETMHFEFIADAVAHGLMKVSCDSLVPCIFGVLTVLNKEQAITRSTGTKNEGLSWGTSAVEMGLNRMAALGMDKKPVAKDVTPFVTFAVNGSLPAQVDGKNSTKLLPKKIGF